jgi:hypothetical protein
MPKKPPPITSGLRPKQQSKPPRAALSEADLEAWRRVENAIALRARSLCKQGCDGGRAEPCAGCCAHGDREWRRDALNELRREVATGRGERR